MPVRHAGFCPRSQRAILLALALAFAPVAAAPACEPFVEVGVAEEEEQARSPIAADVPTPIRVRTLYSLFVTIPVTECFLLACDVTIMDQPWDNDRLIALQPMNRLRWSLQREDGSHISEADLAAEGDALSVAKAGTCSFVAAGIFRATAAGEYWVTVAYRDEFLEAPVQYRFLFSAR